MKVINKVYENFRWFFTSNKVLVVGGKSDEQNEKVLKEFLKPNHTVMHTSLPGSPFMIIVTDNPTKSDLEETAIFCASFSKAWKLGKKLIDIDIFNGAQIFKNKSMKSGTFGVKGDKRVLKVRPELVLVIQNGKLRAVPRTTKEEVLCEIKQGDLTKEEAANQISKIIKDKYHFPLSKEEIMSAIPSDKLSVK
jgi:hypothetical protein